LANLCPIDIVTGFLGSGKTTLLGNLLKKGGFEGTSVIINEYGQAGLDHRLIRRIEERTTLLSGGCVCCNRRDDLVAELSNMLNAHQTGELPLDRVVIETTGMADPAPILFSIFTHPVLVHHYSVESVISCLDAVNGERHLDNNPESVKQIASSDRIVITKTDIEEEEAILRLRERVAEINPAARILEATSDRIPDALFPPDVGRPPRVRPPLLPSEAKGGRHASNIRSMSIGFEEPLDWLAFGVWFSMLLQEYGEKMFRVKGIVDVGEKGPIVLNGVQHVIHPPIHLEDWKDYETRRSEIVFIMRDIEPRRILDSLNAFQRIIGARPTIDEISMDPFSG
jgi:G3E family GTPase